MKSTHAKHQFGKCWRGLKFGHGYVPDNHPQNGMDRFNPFPNDKFKTSKLKEFADDNFKFDYNGGKFSKWLENTVGKGEIARYKQFLLFPLCFQKTCTAYT